MVSSRKRGRQEMEVAEPLKEPSLLERIRNMWEFANLVQWIFIFGRVVKIDENLGIEDLELECLKSHSTVLPELGLALLKFVSSHRGLTPELFDEYTRRQYLAKAPHQNPFGVEEEPTKFTELDIFTKIRVLQQLTQWTMGNPDRIRDKMEEQKDSEQTIWRIEPFGWDSEDRTYLILDDNRLYRRTDPPPPPIVSRPPKKNSKKARAALRASKRRRVSGTAADDTEAADESAAEDQNKTGKEDDGFGGMKWECLAVTLDELNTFIASIEKSRDPNEKALRKRIMDDLLPILEKQEESRKRKAAQKERELINLEKLATAKRSSRIAGKIEQQKQDEEAREAERQKETEAAMAKKEQEKMLKLEKERESRIRIRERRAKEREKHRARHEEELANLSEDSKKLEAGRGRLSERHLKAEIEKKKQALEEFAEEDGWIFDCICGTYGQVDDGTHSIACEKCNIWQHSKCVGVSQEEAERDDFHFVCKTCQRRAEEAERAKTHPPIKIKLNRPGSASSPSQAHQGIPPAVSGHSVPNGKDSLAIASAVKPTVPAATDPTRPPTSQRPQVTQWQSPYAPQDVAAPRSNGYQVDSQHSGQAIFPASTPGANATVYNNVRPHFSPYTNNPAPLPSGASRSPVAHAFSSPHPYSPTNLPPPIQHQSYSFVNGNGSSHGHGTLTASRQQGSPILGNAAGYPSMQSSPSPATPQGYSTSTPSRPTNIQPAAKYEGHNGRNSTDIPYASYGAPVSTPMNRPQPPATVPQPGGSLMNTNTGSQSPRTMQPQSTPSVAANALRYDQVRDPSRISSLPPVATGLSPTKHSPPRPLSSNGNLPTVSPSVLPPVALAPSPQHQNLTPPVKSSEPERRQESTQNLGQ